MKCTNCGNEVPQGSNQCYICGQPVQQTLQPDYPMKWFKFLIYFALFLGAFSNFMSGIGFITGSVYGSSKELVYEVYEGLKPIDTIAGVAMIALAAFGIYTRIRLAGFYKNGPTMVLAMYAGAAALNLVYALAASSVIHSTSSVKVDLTSVYSSIIVSAIMIFANRTYFAKRADLFVN